MRLTIYTDISADQDKGLAAAAYWLKSERGCIIDSVEIPAAFQTSTNAMECYGILVAFQAAFKAWGKTIDIVFLRSDNTAALRSLQVAPDGDRGLIEASAQVRAGIARHELKVIAEHVKGHRNPQSGRPSYLNDCVDKTAREHMRNLRIGSSTHPYRMDLQLRYDSRFQPGKQDLTTKGRYLGPDGKLTAAGAQRITEKVAKPKAPWPWNTRASVKKEQQLEASHD